MRVPLKQCLADERLPREDREIYGRYDDTAMTTAVATYYEAAAAAPPADAAAANDDARSDG
jgi:hypothetical protein